MKDKLTVLGLVSLAVVLFYGLGVFVFSGHYGFRTYVNGQSVFMQTPDEVVLDLSKSMGNQLLTLVRRDGTSECISFGDLGVRFQYALDKKSIPCKSFLWLFGLFHRTDYTVDMSLEPVPELLAKGVDTLECMSESYVKKPSDGYVKLKEDGTYAVVSDSSGNEINREKLISVCAEAVLHQKLTIDLEKAGVYKESVIRQSDLDVKASCDLASIQKIELSLDLGDGVVLQVPRKVIKQAVYESDGAVFVYYPSLYQYAVCVADTYNTVGSQRIFGTSGGDILTLSPSEVDTFYGWDLNLVDTASLLCNQLAAGKSGVVSAVWTTCGSHHGADNDFGDTYVELSIEKQHMWCYVDGTLLFETDVTTGTDAIPSQRTPRGMFMTMDWNTEYTMRGSYGTAFSHYFIRLTPYGVGIHDSSWRRVYGGTEYLNNGSHGCINMPYDKVKLFYDTLNPRAAQGIPVIIY